MWYRILYSLYLVVCLLFSNIPLFAGLSLRHIFTLVMFIICIRQGSLIIDKFLKWLSLFLLFYGVSCILTGYGLSFLNSLLGTFFAAFVIYLSTKVMVRKYDGGDWIVYTIVAIALLNSLIAIGQFYGNSYAMGITTFFSFNIGDDVMEMYDLHTDLHGRYVSGMFDVVSNGYFMSAASILALYNKQGKITIFNAIFAPIFYALFLCQERSGFYGGIICVALYLFITLKNRTAIFVAGFLVLAIAVVYINYGSQLITVGELRYNTVHDEELRLNLIADGWDYVMNHPLGAYLQFVAEGNQQTHNIIINAFLLGGLIGGLIGVGIIVSQLIRIAKILLSVKKFNYSPLLIIMAIAYFDYTLNSFFHNPSLLLGGAMFFVLWGAVVALHGIEFKKLPSRPFA